jgi:hypothetical protein
MSSEFENEEARIREHIRASAPKCLSEFRFAPADDPTGRSDEDLVTSWHISCACQGGRGRVLGYSLRDFNASYVGPLQFVRPLYFECGNCSLTTRIIDEHGYNSEVAKIDGGVGSATFRGTGETSAFRCHSCEATEFEVTVSFIYSDGAFDLFLDEPELPAEDFFDVFEAYGDCVNCGRKSLIASFEG